MPCSTTRESPTRKAHRARAASDVSQSRSPDHFWLILAMAIAESQELSYFVYERKAAKVRGHFFSRARTPRSESQPGLILVPRGSYPPLSRGV
jgi:hypothetical protein